MIGVSHRRVLDSFQKGRAINERLHLSLTDRHQETDASGYVINGSS